MDNADSISKVGCEVCCDEFNKTQRMNIMCPSCQICICRECIRAYLLTSDDGPHCMSCKVPFSKEFCITRLLKSFMYGKYREHILNGLYNAEISQIPNTMPAVKRHKRLGHLNNLMAENVASKKNLKTKLDDIIVKGGWIKREISKLKNNVYAGGAGGSFIKPCSVNDCRGYLSENWKCELCYKETCSECLMVKNTEGHVCNKDDIASAELIKEETKPCPGCGVNIYRTLGCDQMWCVECHATFSWETGIKTNNVIHNPHFFEWQNSEQNAQMINPPEAIMCGGLPQQRNYFNLLDILIAENSYTQEDKMLFDDAKRMFHRSSHISFVGLDALRTVCAQIKSNEDIRVKYILKEIDEKKLRSLIIKRKSTHEKNLDMLGIYELVNTVLIESVKDIFENLISAFYPPPFPTPNIPDVIKRNLERCNTIRDYANDELKKISYLHNNKTVTILNKNLYMYSSRWMEGDSKPSGISYNEELETKS